MNLKYPLNVKVKLVALWLFVAAFLGFAIPASGITFGREVTNGSTAYPSVVSIWQADSADEDAYPKCSGTLITNRIVLTAAHCLDSSGLLYVQYGADQLFDDVDLLPVSAIWKNPRFSSKQLVNDTGLLLLENAIPGAITSRLPSAAEIKSVQASKSVKYEIVGWGKDQNDEPATYLRKAAVDDQTLFMKKAKWWRNDVWFAVGKWNKSEKVFAGACNGDSGGPLFATLGTKTILAGITSWGAEDCETAQPSIYVRLSYYINEINNVGIPTLFVNETKQNRAIPSFTRLPKIIGQAKVGSTISCDTGAVSLNTQEWTYRWTLNGVFITGSPETITLTPNNSSSVSREYICIVTAKNSNGSIVESVSVKQPPLPASTSSATISGIPASASSANSTATCTAAKFSNANSIQNEWWIGNSTYFAPTSKISTGNTINLDTNFYINNGGKYLFCLTRASGDGGVSESISSGSYIPIFPKPATGVVPIVKNVPTAAIVGKVTVSCTPPTFSNSTKVSTDWLIGSTGNFAIKDKVASGNELILSRESFQIWGGKYLYCRTTATGPGGTTEVDSAGSLVPAFAKPIVLTEPKIQGIESFVTPTLGVVLTCPGVKWSGEVLSAETIWYTSIPNWFPSATKILSAESIILTEEFIKSYGGKYLFCSVTATNLGGSAIAYSSAYLSSGFKPTPTPTPSASATPTPTPTASPKPTPTPTPSASATPTPTPTASKSPTVAIVKSQSGDLVTFTLSVSNGVGPYIYEWNVAEGTNWKGRLVSSTSKTSITFRVSEGSTPSFTELSTLYSPYVSQAWYVYANVVDKGAVGVGGGWWVGETNRGLIVEPKTAVPSIYSINVNGIPDCFGSVGCDWIGVTATCDVSASASPGSNYSYYWRIYDLSVPYYPTASSSFEQIGTGKSLLLTDAILKQAVLKKIGCVASITNSAGTATGYSTATYIDYRNISIADTAAPTFRLLNTLDANQRRLGYGGYLEVEISDAGGVGTKPITGIRIISPLNTEVPSSGGFLPTRASGTDKVGIYNVSVSFPTKASGGVAGQYKILLSIFDAKGNWAGWVTLGTFSVTD